MERTSNKFTFKVFQVNSNNLPLQVDLSDQGKQPVAKDILAAKDIN